MEGAGVGGVCGTSYSSDSDTEAETPTPLSPQVPPPNLLKPAERRVPDLIPAGRN